MLIDVHCLYWILKQKSYTPICSTKETKMALDTNSETEQK